MLRELRYYAIQSVKVLNYYSIDIVLKYYGVIKGTDNSSAPRPMRQAVPRRNGAQIRPRHQKSSAMSHLANPPLHLPAMHIKQIVQQLQGTMCKVPISQY